MGDSNSRSSAYEADALTAKPKAPKSLEEQVFQLKRATGTSVPNGFVNPGGSGNERKKRRFRLSGNRRSYKQGMESRDQTGEDAVQGQVICPLRMFRKTL